MIKHSKNLKRQVEKYLKYLTRPQQKLGGHAICPGLAPYRHSIMVLGAELDIESQINKICDLLYPLDIPAALIYTDLPPKDLWDITDAALANRDAIEIFINDPKLKGKYRGLYTGFAHATLIIIQREDLLINSREHAKIAGYYTQKKDNH